MVGSTRPAIAPLSSHHPTQEDDRQSVFSRHAAIACSSTETDHQPRTVVSYWSDLDKPRADALAEILRSAGVASAYGELSGGGDDAPGVLQINFGSDAEK
jgi:hypothetical protein